MLNVQETIDGLKEDIKTEEKPAEEIVEESLQEAEQPVEEPTEEEITGEVAEEEITEEKPVEEAAEDEELPKDHKAWANMRHKIKERDGQIDDLSKILDEMKLQIAQQKGFQDAQINSVVNEPQVDTDPEPDVLLDPEDHTQWSLRQMKKENDQLRTTQGQHATLIQNQQDRQSIAMLENNFTQNNPNVDYRACEEFLKDREKRLLKLQYPQAADSEISAHIEDYKVTMFKEMAASGRDATSLIVELAKENGFEAGKNVKKKPDFATLKKNQAKNASLIGGSDAVKEHGVTSEQICNMSIDQLVKGGKDLFDKAHKSL